MCGGGNSASRAAAAQEAARQATVGKNVSDINSAFRGRTGEYADFRKNLQNQYQTELNRQQGIAARNQKFSLARGGLTGGSAATDAGTLLGQETAQGTVNAQQATESGVAKLMATDEATRQQMIALAQSGGDIGNAATQTANSLRANIGNAQATNIPQGLGDVFGDVTKSVTDAQNAAALRKGILAQQVYGNPKSPGSLGET
jgi:hypothetical protein